MDLISIVVAVYNAENTLERCIDSLLSQTYNNTEIILVNDCSKDNSLSICNAYKKIYENIIVVSNEKNSGVSATRNRGIDKSTGKYICFVDSDDYVEPNYLQVLYEAFKKYNTVPICGFLYHDQVNNQKPRLYQWSGGDELVSLGEAFRLNSELYLTALWNKLFDNVIIKSNNIRFDVNLSIGEDLKFSLEYFSSINVEFVYVMINPLYHYMNVSDMSLMKNFGLDDINNSIANLKLIKNIVSKFNNNAEKEYQKSVDKIKNNYIYHIVRAKGLSDKAKIKKIREFKPKFTKKDLRKEKIYVLKENLYKFLHG